MFAIRVDKWCPDRKKPGMLQYAGQRSMEDVENQIRDVMDGVLFEDDATALEACEWIARAQGLEEFPKGEAVALMSHGGCEGYLVRIVAFDRGTEKYRLCFTLKYLSAKNDVYRLARELNEALWEGGFGA